MKYEVIIFDFDGVIGKTMEDNYRAWSNAFRHYKISLDRKEYFLLEGMSTQSVAENILKKNNMDTILAITIAELKEQYYLGNNSFKFYPNALKLIDMLQSRFKLGLVSGASSKRLKKTVPKDFFKKFSIVITSDSVKNSKPHPEPYLLAGKTLSVAPMDCLVIENAPLGIKSAKMAGMDCIAVCSTLERKFLVEADFIVKDIEALIIFFNNFQ